MEGWTPTCINKVGPRISSGGRSIIPSSITLLSSWKKSACYAFLTGIMETTGPKTSAFSLTWLVLGAGIVFALPIISHWANSWIYSGAAIESLLLVFGPPLQADVPSGGFVLGLNAIYAVASTSWLLHIFFASTCWILVVATSIAQYAAISSFTRGRLRRLLQQVHFHRDKVAFFNFPVLIIDSEINGFVAVHGVTASLLTLSIEFHSIDLST